MKKKSEKIKVSDALNKMLPRIVFPQGKTGSTSHTGDGGSSFNFTTPMPFQPEFATIDRVMYPIDRLQQNRYARLYYKLNPIIGPIIEMYSEIIASDFTLSGEGIDGEIKDTFELMIEKTKIKSAFKYFITEYLSMGEVLPHLFFDKDKRIWTDITFHNPDQVKIIDAPFISFDPIMEFVPDEGLKQLVKMNHPAVQKVMSKLPPDVFMALQTGKSLPLDPLNATFIARKIHPYDVRGTSILTRLFGILMYSDAIQNACYKKFTKVLMSNYIYKPIQDIIVGDCVIDKDGVKQIVEDTWSEKPKKDLVKITLQGGDSFECTENHTFPVFAYPRTCECGCGGDVSNRKSFIATHGNLPLENKWSKNYNKCFHCGTISVSYGAKGLCKNCYASYRRGTLDVVLSDVDARCNKADWVSYGSVNLKHWAKRRFPSSYNPYQKVEASQIKKYDFLMLPRKFEVKEDSTASPDLARLLGYYVAEGFKLKLSNGSNGIRWTFNIKEKDTWVKDIGQICAKMSISTNVYIGEENSVCTIDFCKHENSYLADWILNYGGEYSKTKELSSAVMSWSLELKKEFIKGCFRGDGSRYQSKKGQWAVSYASVSYNLISQIRIILNQLGIFTGFDTYTKNGVNKGTIHRLSASGKFARDLMMLVWGEESLIRDKDTGVWVDSDYIYVPVKKIERTQCDEEVYNLTVSGSHSYLAEGIGTYNSIATARRHSGPVKICKLGAADVGGKGPWVPEQEYQDKMIQMLTVAEQDPHAFLILPWFVNFEAFGTTDRMLTIRNEYEVIERIILTALGVSQGFLHGESTYCLLFDTKVLTNGWVYKPIQDIILGDCVIDKDGVTQVVQKAWNEGVPETLIEINLVGGQILFCTDNHKFPVWAWPRVCACGCGRFIKSGYKYGKKCLSKIDAFGGMGTTEAIGEISHSKLKSIPKSYNPSQTLEASNIHKYDCLMIPRKFDEGSIKDLTLDHAKLLGFYVAEGCYCATANPTTHNDALQWTFNIKEKDTYAKEVVDAGKVLGMDFHINLNEKGATCSVRSAKKGYLNFYQWLLTNGGKYSHLKQLSPEVMRWPLAYKEELLRAMFKGDGSRSNFKKLDKRVDKTYNSFVVQYGTVSKVLADQLLLMLAQLGIYACVDKVKKIPKEDAYNRRDAYNIKCYGDYAQKLAKLVWNEDIALNYVSRSQVWFDDNFLYVPVKSVKTIENTKKLPVYNLTVSGSHSYLAEGFGTFNSSMKGNMSTLLMRLKGLRTFFENIWWYPKFLRPISEMNEFVKPTQAEVSHRLRFRRSKRELLEENRYLIPTINWQRTLDPKVDNELLDAYEQLVSRLNFKVSESTAYSAVGLDFEEEQNAILADAETKKRIAKEHGMTAEQLEEEISEVSEGIVPGTSPEVTPGGEELPLTEEAPAKAETPVGEASKHSSRRRKAQPVMKEKAVTVFDDNEVQELSDLIQSGKVSKRWAGLLKKGETPEKFSKNFEWYRVAECLEDEGYSADEISSLRKSLIVDGAMEETKEDAIEKMVSSLTPESSDAEFNRIADTLVKAKRLSKEQLENTAFFVGSGNQSFTKEK